MDSRRHKLFPDIPDEQWNDWHWQVRNRIESLEQLKKYVTLTPEEEEGVKTSLKTLRMAITPYYLTLIDPTDPHDPVRRQAIPSALETHISSADQLDPLHEDEDSPVPGLTHRYPDRVLMLITDMCSMYCRHCTRRRFAGHTDAEMPRDNVEGALEYIARTPQIRDVVLSGGDALMVSDAFFPFRDGIDVGLREGVTAVIQPGGSINDYQSIEACNEYGACMVFTGQRSFKH